MMAKTQCLSSTLLILLAFVGHVKSHAYCTSTYGRQICSFLPAPPGKTPHCATPGLTYCEHPKNYPGERIQYLIQKWRLDHSTILIDESKEEFTSYHYPTPAPKYGPPEYHSGHFYPEPIHIPKPHYTFSPVGNGYIPPPENSTRLENYKYANDIPASSTRYVYGAPNLYPTTLSLPQTNPYVKIWNRKDRRRKRSVLRFFNEAVNGTRTKRQSSGNGQTLCETRSQFIMPRAALNNKGNWMYVVNMPELDNRYSQLVKSETCASQTCSGLCSLPVGYSSRCEQKFVQKRLVALEGSGDELYSDIFWFPSCCVCTISNG